MTSSSLLRCLLSNFRLFDSVEMEPAIPVFVESPAPAPTYRGVLLGSPTTYLSQFHELWQALVPYQAEVNILGRLLHPNLIQLLDCCMDENLVQVYKFMGNGSLNDHLFKRTEFLSTFLGATDEDSNCPMISGELNVKVDVYGFGIALLNSLARRHIIRRQVKQIETVEYVNEEFDIALEHTEITESESAVHRSVYCLIIFVKVVCV
ncbi:hypothetical protein OPV22_003764 [Ensete ventricosum]|uniref:Serine-threonine/tyrosine-protein kinase catalytic domain-containing protein n=1 Tax=Ensete ventricosum TaxID=4639 RepID=A0AAV8S1I1_ENSVE|nr:hypothetical protein OPV22_003764 [Ensete ventricosum]